MSQVFGGVLLGILFTICVESAFRLFTDLRKRKQKQAENTSSKGGDSVDC